MSEQTVVRTSVALYPQQMEVVRRVSRGQGESGISAALRRIIDEWDRAQRRAEERDDGQITVPIEGGELTF